MSFRLWTIFYVFALLAAAMATFGPGGIIAAGLVLGFWSWAFYGRSTAGCLGLLFVGAIVLIALLLPSIQSAREAARRVQCANNLKQIILALINYDTSKGTFPPSSLDDVSGTPMHSWRVLILPYLEQQRLFTAYNFNEAWNGPNNSKLAGQMLDFYRCPSTYDDRTANKFETNYFMVAGPGTAAGKHLASIRDGAANTILVIEASGLDRNWMEPGDLTIDEAVELLTTKPRSGHRHVSDGFLTTKYYETSQRNVAFCDGHVEFMGQLKDASLARALLTADGGEPIPEDLEEIYVPPTSTTVVKWGRVWGLSVFVILSLLPATRLLRNRAVKE
jgi:prepilin-type processing-associated H-X9-DG protein